MKRFLKHSSIAFLLACGAASVARADVVLLTEGFQGLVGGQYDAPASVGPDFFVQGGSVDVFDSGFFGSLCTAAGGASNCIDLVGGSDPAGGTLSSNQFFGPGNYRLSFQLAGSQRSDTNTTSVFFGDQIVDFTRDAAADFTTVSILATVNPTNPSRVVFFNPGTDGSGNLLDNVHLTQVIPEPSALLFVMTGLIGVGALAGRRRNAKG